MVFSHSPRPDDTMTLTDRLGTQISLALAAAMTLAGSLEVSGPEGQRLGRDPGSLIGMSVWEWVAYQANIDRVWWRG